MIRRDLDTPRIFSASLLVFIALSLSACKFTVRNGFISSHSEEIEAFSDQAIKHFYDDEMQALVDLAKGDNGFSLDTLSQLEEFKSDTSRPDQRRVLARSVEHSNGQKYYVSLVGVPRSSGRESITVTIAEQNGECCKLIGFFFKAQLGEEYLLENLPEDVSTSEANQEEG